MTSPIPSEPRTQSTLYHAAPRPAAAAWIAAGAIATIYGWQILLVAFGLAPLVAAAISYAVTIALVTLAARRTGTSLAVTLPPLRFVIGAVLIGIAAWYVDLRIATWLEPPGDTKALEQLVDQPSIVGPLLAIALLPAIAEELVFRGVIARALAPRSLALAIFASAALFSLYHLLPVQMVSTFPLGLALAVLALRSGSVVPGMITHFLNNATVIWLQDQLRHHPESSIADMMRDHPNQMLAAALAIVAIGLGLSVKSVAA